MHGFTSMGKSPEDAKHKALVRALKKALKSELDVCRGVVRLGFSPGAIRWAKFFLGVCQSSVESVLLL